MFSAQEFTELQTQQNDDLTKCCENFFETLDGFAETKNKHRSATWPLQMMLLVCRLVFCQVQEYF
jgi:neurofibromin 1